MKTMIKPKVKVNNTFLNTCRSLHQNINPDMLNGFATREVANGIKYLVDTIRNIIVENGLSNRIQLEHIIPMSPSAIMNIARNQTTAVDISRSSLLSYELTWTYNGTIITNRLLLPTPKGNTLTLADVNYLIIPEITDMVISVLQNDVILITLIKKIIKVHQQVLVTLVDKKIHVGRVIFSRDLLKLNNGKIRIPLLLYSLIKEGIETIMPSIKIIHETDEFDKEAYMPVSSRKMKGVGTNYVILIPRGLASEMMIHRATQLIYMFDMVKDMDEELFNMFDNVHTKEEEDDYWKSMMSLIVSDVRYGVEYNRDIVLQHLSSLENLNEFVTFDILKKVGITVNSYVELLLKVSDNFIDWTIGNNVDEFNYKRLEVNPKLYKPVTNRVARLMTTLKDNPKTTTVEMENRIKNEIRPGAIFEIKTDQSILYLKEQINANNAWGNLKLSTQNRRGSAVEELIPTADATTIGNLNIINKNIPYPTAFVNPTLNVNDETRIIDKDEDMDILEEKLRR
jgi:competence protein ComGF